MRQDIYIGVDGGATKSKVRIETAEGVLIGQALGGPANITRFPAIMAFQAIQQAIDDILLSKHMRLDDAAYRFHIGLGLAGYELPSAREDYLNLKHPFATVELSSDAHVACLGAHNGEQGAIIIIGTGVVGYQIEKNHTAKVGGWGFPHSDEGGGAWLGLEAVRLTFQWLDQRIEKSPLLKDVFAFFENDLNRFVTWANRASSSEFGRIAPLVINHSQQGDVYAVKLMKKAAAHIDRLAHALEKHQHENDHHLPCALFGGIAPFVEPWLSAELQARLRPRLGDANTGAILLVKKAMQLG